MRSLPSYEFYWSKDLCVDYVANVTSLKQYELIRRYLHTNDNTAKKADSSRLFKFETVANALHTNCLSKEQEQYLSINEQMVPAKTKRSGVLEYLPRKIHKVGIQKTLFRQVPLESFVIYLTIQDKKVLGERNVVHLK